jgi:hypothetical protein
MEYGMNVGFGRAVALDTHSKTILLASLLALMRGNATFFEMSNEVQMNIMWLADTLAREVMTAVSTIS